VRPFVWAYLLATSLVVLARVILKRSPLRVSAQGPALGGVAGFLDAIGGGGWGTIVTSTMIARGVTPRYAIGTSNAVVFFVALATSLTLWLQLGTMRYDMVLALLIGGAAAAPIAAWVTSRVPQRAATAVMTFPLLVRAIRLSLENVDRGLEEAARTLGASAVDRFLSITLPLMLPGILAGAVTAFAAGLGEFGAVITFASNVPGVTRTLPLALYTAMQSPTGDALALRLAVLSFALGLAGLVASELLVRRVRRLLGP
jgi:molybdate transport system permease protein